MTKRIVAVFVTCMTLLTMFCGGALANENTTYTYTISASSDGVWIRTQDAYMPAAIYLQGELSSPEDMYVTADGVMYVADTGNSRILIYNTATGQKREIGNDVLKSPTGVFVTDDNEIYVADFGNKMVYGFRDDGELFLEIGRPDSYLFSEQSTFEPRNVAVSSSKTIYVVGVGAFEGLMLFNPQGEFQGYFGANPREITPLERMQEIILSRAQMETVLTRKPRPITNLTLKNDLVYTITMTPIRGFSSINDPATSNSIRRLNMAGQNILNTGGTRIMDEANFIDIAVSKRGCIFAVSQSGVITEYDPNGEVVFSLGGKATSVERIGLFTFPAAIDVDDKDFVYVLDKERGLAQVYYPTDFAKATHLAIEAFEEGNFTESLGIWEDLLKLNGMSKIAHNGLGKSLYSLGRYDEAMKEFEYTYNREEYSNAFWEVRNIWIMSNIATISGVVVVLVVILYVLSLVDKKTKVFTNLKNKLKPKGEPNRLWSDIRYIKTVFMHPIDSMYDLKTGKHGSVKSATIMYIIAYVVVMANMLLSAFLFRGVNSFKYLTVEYLLAMFFLPCALWVVGNYLISSINEGEGSFKNVYVCTAYSFAPVILLMPFVVVITYFCTFNDSFIIELSRTIIMGWTVIYFVLMVLEVHRFSFKNMVKNVLLTVFAIIIAIVGFLIIYLMAKQVYGFVLDVAREVMFRES